MSIVGLDSGEERENREGGRDEEKGKSVGGTKEAGRGEA